MQAAYRDNALGADGFDSPRIISSVNPAPLRLAELLAALSLAQDLGTGQPLEWVMKCGLLGVRLADYLGLSDHDRREVYYLSLLRHIGCTATASLEADLFADELQLGEGLITDSKNLPQALGFLFRNTARGQTFSARARFLGKALTAGPAVKDVLDTIQCEAAVTLAGALGFTALTQYSLNQVFERWDGQGQPNHLRHDALALPVRVIQVAQMAVTFQMLAGTEAAVRGVREHAGKSLDPALAAAFQQSAHDLLGGLTPPSLWEAVLAAEPHPSVHLTDEQFETALYALADFADMKSPFLLGHSRRVGELAAQAGERLKWSAAAVRQVKHAGLIHDIGRVGVSASIWNKAGPLAEGEWERVRLHPNFTERIFARSSWLSELGTLAALHHERLDGTGYHRRLPASLLAPAARVLAAADVYSALRETRPQRAALAPDQAVVEVRREAKAGRLDGDAVSAVLEAAGHWVEQPRRGLAAHLTPRELEVIRLLVRGHTTKAIAQQLSITRKTTDHHIQNIYSKIGVSTRAGATLYALQSGLI